MGPVVPAMASLVQDVWLGWEPRLRARRLGPWEEPSARVIFHLDAGTTLNDPLLAGFLDLLASRLEVIACEPRGQGGSGGRLGPEVVADARRLMEESPRRWGDGRSVLLGGLGLGAWLALATADGAGVVGAFALAPSRAAAGPAGPEPGPLRAALEAAGFHLLDCHIQERRRHLKDWLRLSATRPSSIPRLQTFFLQAAHDAHACLHLRRQDRDWVFYHTVARWLWRT